MATRLPKDKMGVKMTRATRSAIDSRMKYLGEDEVTAMKAVNRENTLRACDARGEPSEDYVPDEKMLPDDGGWIQVKFPPHTVVPVEYLSCWYAVPTHQAEEWNHLHLGRSRYTVRVLTPIGEVWLFPHEYTVVEPEKLYSYINMVGEDKNEDMNHVTLHWLDPRNDQFDCEKLHYIMSRGIKKADAYKMLLGEIHSPHACYLTFNVEYQRIFAGVGVTSFNANAAVNARASVNSHIDYCVTEKTAGRWYKNPAVQQAI